MTNSDSVTAVGPFRFDRDANELTCREGRSVQLRPQTAKVLSLLADNAGSVVTKDQLMADVWPNTFVTDDSLVQCISEIRKALGPDGSKLLKTVPKRGYSLRAEAGSPDAFAGVPASWRGLLLPAGVVAVVLVLVGLAALWWATRPAGEGTMQTIAVLPFANASGDEAQAYFANGVAEDLIVGLSKISDLRVVSRGASFALDSGAMDIRAVADILNADYVLEGSVRRAGDDLRVSAALVDGATGKNAWAERYDGATDDIFAFQETLLSSLMKVLSVRLSRAERERLGVYGTRDIAAYDAYLRGRELENLYTRETNLQAEEALLTAIRLDPEYALPHALLSQIYSFRAENRWVEPIGPTVDKAMKHARRAVSLDDSLPFAHFALGRLHTRSFSPDFEIAIAELRRAIELDPNYVDAYMFLANTYIFDGRAEEALPLIAEGFERNPIAPYWYYLAEGMAAYFLGQYENAEKSLTVARDRNPTAPYPYRFLIATHGQLGQIDEAEWMAMEYEALGRTATVSAMLETASIQDPSYRERFADGFRKAGLPE
ncbi:winged helix-turn-helix domain-containing protein [Oricola sp.]|uniref:winged helix-turn-helix domain-containing protein n=1 Tax=Oricola sp. TaxID=1979950 RepID=UPI0025FF1CE5|nr:winged helix-turn-helix domain-containing protein [Oricola sp.]MCI5075712.1 winged helix-turn-helix domain-containing protein [Oricola sp.]